MSISHVSPSYEDVFREGLAFKRPLENGAVSLFRQGRLYLFDPMAGDQCHLTAYRTVQMYRRQEVDRQQLCLSLLINSCFNREKKHIAAVAGVENVGDCTRFLTSKNATKTAKQVVVQGIHVYIRQELARFSSEPLLQEASDLDGCSYPKFAGVKLLIKQLNAEPVPVVLKIKVLCPSGNGLVTFVVYRPEETLREPTAVDEQTLRDEPVLVVEGLSVVYRPVGEVMNDRPFCRHSLIQHSAIKPHPEAEECLYCHKGNEGGKQAVAETSAALKGLSFQQLLSSAGAAFTNEVQPKGRERILQSPLKEDFEQSLMFAEDHFISVSNRRSICMVEHMYPDLGVRALSKQRLLDTTPSEVMQMGGVQ